MKISELVGPVLVSLVLSAAATLPSATGENAARAGLPKLVLTSVENGTVGQNVFPCEGKIHGYITFSKKIVGRHVIDVSWKRPDGKIQDMRKIPLEYPAPGRQTAYVWLRFDSHSGGLLSSVQDNPESDRAFNGEWEVTLLLDGSPLTSQKFQVKC